MRPIQFRTRIFQQEWSRDASERVLDIMLEALVQIDKVWLQLNPRTPDLYASGVRYYHEGIVDEWLSIEECLHEGVADCKSLSPWLVAQLHVSGVDRGAKVVKKFATITDPTVGDMLLYHVLVQRGDGTIEDPSQRLGMHHPEPDGYIPVPGVPWVIVNGLEHAIGAGMQGDDVAVAQLEELRIRAEAGDARAKYLINVARLIRAKGYDPAKTEWTRLPDGSWDWFKPGEAP